MISKEYPIYLIGIMGAGKSSIGFQLARKRKVKFIDIDAWIEAKEDKTASEIFEKFGESKWRVLEKEALNHPDMNSRAVIATGGGIVTDEQNLNFMLENGCVVWIDRDIKSYADTIKKESRPLLKNGVEPLYELYESRKAFYEKADIRFINKYPNVYIAVNRLNKILKNIKNIDNKKNH